MLARRMSSPTELGGLRGPSLSWLAIRRALGPSAAAQHRSAVPEVLGPAL